MKKRIKIEAGKSYLSLWALVLLSVNAVLNIRGLPIFSHIGLQALGFYVLASLGFLIPSSLVCAELASRVGTSGGVYAWVRAAFGEKTGFLSIWLEWINNVIAFPATLSTISATVFYLVIPDMTEHRGLFFLMMMMILWGLSALNLRGVNLSVKFSAVGAVLGTIIPGMIVILLGVAWWLMGKNIGFLEHPTPIFPAFNFSSLSLWVGVMGALSGMQITAFHLGEVKNPQKIFPKVMAIATVMIIALSLGAIFAMSAVVTPQELNLLSGVIQMYQTFFMELHVSGILPFFVMLLAFGMMASMSAWMLGPARGLQVAAASGHLPGWFARVNKAGMPKNILITQAVISSLFATVFIWMPSLKEAFWMLVALTSQFTVLMYVLIFAALIKLNFNNFNNISGQSLGTVKPFRVWGGFPMVCLVSGLGLVSCVIAFCVGIFPPTQLGLMGASGFMEKMLWIDGVILLFPYLFKYFFKKKSRLSSPK